jgi:hypothetical protein
MEPLVGVAPWLPSLDVSVDFSVRKLFRDLLRISLKLKKDGVMVASVWRDSCSYVEPAQQVPSRPRGRRAGKVMDG